MALISRVSRLFTADVHAVLDRIEEPEALLKHAIREMEDEIAKGEQRLKWLRHEQQQLEGRRAASDAAMGELDAELDICFEADEDDLARSLVKRKLGEAERVKLATAQLDALASSIVDVATVLEDQRHKLDEMRQNAEVLVDTPVPGPRPGESAISSDEVDVAFLREKQRRMRT
jgi:phage shock protein A